MQHFILTRFNLHLCWSADKNGADVQTDLWLEKRFTLFETYCLPSIQSQTNRNFKWICLFDAGTSEKYRERISGYSIQCHEFMPFYLSKDEASEFRRYFQQKVYELSDKDDTGLLTTYLDNDDVLRCDFVEKVQKYTERVGYNTVFTFKYGIQYYTDYNIAVRIPYANNHFLTYYEKLSPVLRTVWGFWHFYIFKYSGIRIIMIDNPRNPMWIETIHDGNIDNDVKMTVSHRLLLARDILHRYGLAIDLPGRMSSLLIFSTRFQIRFLFQVKRRIRNKIRMLWQRLKHCIY